MFDYKNMGCEIMFLVVRLFIKKIFGITGDQMIVKLLMTHDK